jgi:hypothetical protein
MPLPARLLPLLRRGPVAYKGVVVCAAAGGVQN